MKDFVVELKPAISETIRIQTRPSGDLEVVKSVTVGDGAVETELDNDGKEIYHTLTPGVNDQLLSVIPKDKRAALAEFIATA